MRSGGLNSRCFRDELEIRGESGSHDCRSRRGRACAQPGGFARLCPVRTVSSNKSTNKGKTKQRHAFSRHGAVLGCSQFPQRSAATIAFGSGARNTLLPATRTVAPAAMHCCAVSGVMPPSTSISMGSARASIMLRSERIFSSVSGMKARQNRDSRS